MESCSQFSARAGQKFAYLTTNLGSFLATILCLNFHVSQYRVGESSEQILAFSDFNQRVSKGNFHMINDRRHK